MRVLFIAALCFFIFPVSTLLAGGGVEPVSSDHWKRPFAASGDAAVSPYPENCKACHPSQFESWSKSLHSGAMSPGLLMQMDSDKAPAFVKSCLFCHAPAIEQSEVIERGESDGESEVIERGESDGESEVIERGESDGESEVVERGESDGESEVIEDGDGFRSNPAFDLRLAKSGVNCAVCHLRAGEVVGPPNPSEIAGEAPHEIREDPLFESAEFCAACHQMDRGYELNGKVLTNTYREWKESYYGRNNITCQKCHMPKRRHEFRGIHDPVMVRKGLDIRLLRVPSSKPGGVRAALSIKNARVGHMFPTYVTPIVVVKAYQVDAMGEEIEGSVEKGFIGRLISQDLAIEYFDTRLAPFQSYVLEYDTAERNLKGAKKLVFEITVRPDEFYDRMFKRAIEHGASGFKETELRQAEERTDKSSYVLFTEEIEIED